MSDATRPPRPPAPLHGNGEASGNRALTITTENIQKVRTKINNFHSG